MLTHAIPSQPVLEFAADVRAGLTRPQKELLSKYLYDDVGSALFEVISVLPEYGLTRADERVLHRNAYEIVERLPLPLMVAELGSGSGKKTRWLLKALARRQHTAYCPIEISPTALAMCKRELGDIDAISIVGFEREYLDGLAEVAARRKHNQHLLVLFLGSTIGNFDRPAGIDFLKNIRASLRPGDSLLLGTDPGPAVSKCTCDQNETRPSPSPPPGSRCGSPPAKPFGRKVATNTRKRKSVNWRKTRVFVVTRNGSIRNGPSRKACWWRNSRPGRIY